VTKTVALAMLVRDEATVIEKTLERIKPVIDAWTIVDTGSTDDTADRVRAALDEIPGELHERPWVNFGRNRTELLQLAAESADYLLTLDADHVLHIHGEQSELTDDSYLLRINGTGCLEWRLPLLIRSAHPFEYRGAAHSYLASDAPTVSEPIDWLRIDGGPGASAEKLERDRLLLEAAHLDDPSDARTVFYLAQTYRDLHRVQQAIGFYRLRAEMGGFPEEVYVARYELGKLLVENVSFAQGAPELLRAWNDRPTRIEALRALANSANAVADKAAFPSGDKLFIQPHCYAAPAAEAS